MLLRWLVTTWFQQSGREKMRDAVQSVLQDHLRPKPAAGRPAAPGAAAPDDAEPVPPLPCDVAFIFALNIEAGGLVDFLQDHVRTHCATFVEHGGLLGERRVILVETGVGRDAAARVTEDVIAVHKPAWVVSAGFAGALRSELKRGHVLMADVVADESGQSLAVGLKLDPQTVAATPGLHVGRLLTVDRLIRDAAERGRLAEQHDALACDMETAAVAETCRRLKTRFLSVRIISDTIDDVLPKEIENLLDQSSLAGKIGAVTGAILNRPSSVKDIWQLREQAIKASDRLANFLTGVVSQLN